MHRIIIVILILVLIIYYLYKKNNENYVSIPQNNQAIINDIYSIIVSNTTQNPNQMIVTNKITQDVSATQLTIGNNLSTQKIIGNNIKANVITSESVNFINDNKLIVNAVCDFSNNCLSVTELNNLNYLVNPKIHRMYFPDASNCIIFEKLNFITIGFNNQYSILGTTTGKVITTDTTPSATVNPFLYNTDKIGYYCTPQANNDSDNNMGFVVNIPTPAQLGFTPSVLWIEVYNLNEGGKSFQVSDGVNFSVKIGSYRNNYNIMRPDGGISSNLFNLDKNSYWFSIPFDYNTISSQKILYVSRYVSESGDFKICGLAFTTNPWNHFSVPILSIRWNLNNTISDMRGPLSITTNISSNEFSIYLNTSGKTNKSNIIVRIPVVNSGKDKVLYLISTNEGTYSVDVIKGVYIFTNPNIHPSIASTTKDLTTATTADTFDNPMVKLTNFSASFNNPFSRNSNSSNYRRYTATIIPKQYITSNFIIIGMQYPYSISTGWSWSTTRIKEMGTHDLLM
jgi:hypothetical protein